MVRRVTSVLRTTTQPCSNLWRPFFATSFAIFAGVLFSFAICCDFRDGLVGWVCGFLVGGVVVATSLRWGGGGCDGSEKGIVVAAATDLRW
ncbi:hypothetical protein A2U01_0057745, partial [Trifolium medium]|nr:hypothetical protein [Trifolium medium]